MTYEEFKKKHNGKKCDFDSAYGAQCWDLAQFYITECLGLPSSILSGCGLVSNMLKKPKIDTLLKYFDEVKKSDIKQGDVVIWTYGHIAIYDSKKKGVNYYFSQNPNAPKVITVNNKEYRVFRKKTTKKEDTKKESKTSSTNSGLLNLVRRTIRGDFGNGKNRKRILGSNYDKVQYQVEQNLKHKTTSWDKIKLY